MKFLSAIEPGSGDSAWGVLAVPVERFFGPAEKVNIPVPARVLARIHEYARRHGESRSGFLVRAAQQAMQG